MGSTKGTTKSQGNKDEFDRFYTDTEEAVRLLTLLEERMPEVMSDKSRVIICEPSAGAGAFVRAAELAGYDTMAYDLVPAPEPVCETKIVEQDFLDENFMPVAPDGKVIVTLGNPPFGTNGTLAFQFVAKSMEFSEVVAFVMPPSACKESAKKKTGSGRMRSYDDIDNTDFAIPTGEKIAVPSKFVIYTKVTDDDIAEDKRRKEEDKENLASIPFEFVSESAAKAAKANGKTAFCIRRVGGTAGTVKDTLDLSKESNYFCVMRDDSEYTVEEIADILAEPIPERELSVGPRSLSRPEIARAVMARIAERE